MPGNRHRREKILLGLWIAETEGANFWHGVVTELRNKKMKIY